MDYGPEFTDFLSWVNKGFLNRFLFSSTLGLGVLDLFASSLPFARLY